MTTTQIPFNRNAVEPAQCIRAGWELVKDRYWLFVGITLVAVLIAGAVPFWILMGPMMCGLNLALLKQRRRLPVEFGDLFKGFDYFGQSFVATLLFVLPVLMIVVPAYILFYVGMILSIAAQSASGEPNPAAAVGVVVMFGLFVLVVMVVMMVISIGFIFTYPLIVDRKLSGFDAVKLSFKAAMANFWRLFLMMILTGLLGLAGYLVLCFGVFLVLPITYAAIAIAYEQVFGLSKPEDMRSDLPPPPPTFT